MFKGTVTNNFFDSILLSKSKGLTRCLSISNAVTASKFLVFLIIGFRSKSYH